MAAVVIIPRLLYLSCRALRFVLRLWKQEEQWHKGKENISLARKLSGGPPFFQFQVFPGLTTILKLLDGCSLRQRTTKLSEGKDQMPVWGRFHTASSSVNACPHFNLVSQVNPVFALLWNLDYISAVPQGLPQELISCPVFIPFTHSECLSASTTSAVAARGFAPPCPQSHQHCCEYEAAGITPEQCQVFPPLQGGLSPLPRGGSDLWNLLSFQCCQRDGNSKLLHAVC